MVAQEGTHATGFPVDDETFVGVIFIAVDARTEYEAIAKGTAACRQLVTTDGSIDNYELVSETTKPAPQLLERWESLPDATRTSSETGQRLLERLRDVIDSDTPGWATAPSEFQVLYDEWGTAIFERDQIATLEEASHQWLVPALALQEQPDREHSNRLGSCIPTKQRLFCRHCDEETGHTLEGRDTVPDPSIPETPIWECNRCETPRHGPVLE
ncbi:hypothetical protein [Halomontanus rarus]|uniref:hypothetical protein n=1 Tax=Halomontanus rarus TaxID=3034020 RepID=UPI0023E850AB|nr:hypothetical protein [Halovivax sp. TS33]